MQPTDSPPSALRRLVQVLALVVGLAPLYHLAPLFTDTSLRAGLGAFEPTADGTTLRYGEQLSEDMLPLSVNELDGNVFVAVGTTAVVALEMGTTITVRSADSQRAAWVLVGVEGQDVTPAMRTNPTPESNSAPERVDLARSGHQLRHSQVLLAADDTMTFARWEGIAVWADDETRLHQLSAQCSARGNGLRLQRVNGGIDARLGTCHAQWLVGDDASVRVAIAGEVAGAVFALEGTSLASEVRPKPFALAILVALFLVQLLAFGIVPTASIGLLCFVTAHWNLPLTGTAWIQIAILALLITTTRQLWSLILRLHVSSRAPLWLLAPVVGAIAVVSLIGGLSKLDLWFTKQMRTMAAHTTPQSDSATVLFMGYSTAESVTLPDTSLGAASYLSNVCQASRQRILVSTHIGATFSLLADRLCSDAIPSTIREVVFFGGANDDVSNPKPMAMLLSHYASMVWLRLAPPEASLGAASFEAAGRRLANAELQASDLQRAQKCLAARGARLLYFNDFLVTDMQGGRGPARTALLEIRRRAVEDHGGKFFDLWQAFHSQAGVAWFNDFIHPSAIGHQHIARLMCEALTAEQADPARPWPQPNSET